MKLINKLSLIIFSIFTTAIFSCNGQTSPTSSSPTSTKDESAIVGGPFENGDFFYINMPDHISSIDTSPGWNQKGQRLLIKGKMYKKDGKTPAPDVVLYYYHTDVKGLYSDKEGLDKRVIRHGYIRGWVKSDKDGSYAIYTVRPAPYPGEAALAHIHPAIKEPDIDKEYYIDEFVFEDDKLLTTGYRQQMQNRGGGGILKVITSGDLQIAEHNIILGLNIPNYPDGNKD